MNSARVIKKLLISLICALMSWSSADACLPISEVWTGEQYYNAISKRKYWDIFGNKSAVALVYANEVKRKRRKDPKDNYNQPGKKTFIKIDFETIDILFGDYENVDSDWFPLLNDIQMLEELEYKNEDKDFDFWDRMDLTTQKADGFGAMTSCGLKPTPTIAPNNYYLHFKHGNSNRAFEIVSGKDAQLVKDFKAVFMNSSYSKLRRKPKDYFKHMRGYVELEVAQCPEFDRYGSSAPFVSSAGYTKESPSHEYDGRQSFSKKSEFNSSIEDVRIIDFYSYLNRLQENSSKCVVGDKYLVVDRLSHKAQRGYNGGFVIRQPQHRFLKIENGGIDPKNIISNIDIISNELIPTHQVKSWISEAKTP